MTSESIKQLQQFISGKKLRREDGLIVFEAAITFLKASTTIDFYSEIHVVTLPKEMVLYIMESTTPPLSENDMYSTALHEFTCLPENKLKIADNQSGNHLFISLD